MDNASPDRLLPRHDVTGELELQWNTGVKKRRFRAPESHVVTAYVRELSLAGALVDAPLPPCLEVGDRLEVRLGGRSAVVEIKHARPSGVANRALYGIEFIDSADITAILNEVVGELRGSKEDLEFAWSRTN